MKKEPACREWLNYARMESMSIYDPRRILHRLRTALLPVEQASLLDDEIEGAHPNARRAAVLLALYEQEGEVFLAFIRRSSSLRNHSGQIAFPGGAVDPQDSSLVMTALREAQEEIGLALERATILGMLPPVFTVVSNYLIAPIVAFYPQGLGDLLLQESEVTELLLAPLAALLDPSIAHTEEWPRDETTRTIYFYDYGSYRIWGATGRILSTLLEIIKTPE